MRVAQSECNISLDCLSLLFRVAEHFDLRNASETAYGRGKKVRSTCWRHFWALCSLARLAAASTASIRALLCVKKRHKTQNGIKGEPRNATDHSVPEAGPLQGMHAGDGRAPGRAHCNQAIDNLSTGASGIEGTWRRSRARVPSSLSEPG